MPQRQRKLLEEELTASISAARSLKPAEIQESPKTIKLITFSCRCTFLWVPPPLARNQAAKSWTASVKPSALHNNLWPELASLSFT